MVCYGWDEAQSSASVGKRGRRISGGKHLAGVGQQAVSGLPTGPPRHCPPNMSLLIQATVLHSVVLNSSHCSAGGDEGALRI